MMKVTYFIPFLAALMVAVAPAGRAQESPDDPVSSDIELTPASDLPPPIEPVPAPPLPVADSDAAATPVAPRDLSPPIPAEGGTVTPLPAAELAPPKPATPTKKPAAKPATSRKPATTTSATAPSSAEAVMLTVRVGRDGPKENILISLRPDVAPLTVENFKRNIESGFYEGLAFHRLIRNYLIQAGDPLTKDDGQKELWGTTDIGQNIPGEFRGSHTRYAVAMAHKTGETTSSGSQFFITLRPATSLDGSYAVFGEVTQGMDVLNRLSGAVVDTNDVPVKRIEIVEAKLVRGDTQLTSAGSGEGRRKTKPDSQKGRLERFIERVW